MLIVGLVGNKKIKVHGAAQPHEPWLKQNQQKAIDSHPPEKTLVSQGKSDGKEPEYKTKGTKQNGDGITQISGSIPETHFQFEELIAFGATGRHFEGGPEAPGIGHGKH